MTGTPAGGGNKTVSRVAWSAAGALIALMLASLAMAGVRYGDAVPGIVRKSDPDRIRRQLDLERFSVIAAVWLGAVDGREAIVAEPLSDDRCPRRCPPQRRLTSDRSRRRD